MNPALLQEHLIPTAETQLMVSVNNALLVTTSIKMVFVLKLTLFVKHLIMMETVLLVTLDTDLVMETAQFYQTHHRPILIVPDGQTVSVKLVQISVGTIEEIALVSTQCVLDLTGLMGNVLVVILVISWATEDAFWIQPHNQAIFFAEDGILLVFVFSAQETLSLDKICA